MMKVLDVSTQKVLVIQASGEVEDSDYQNVLIPEIQKMKDANGEIRVVIYFDESFSGYSMGAMVDDAVFGIKNLSSFTKVSIMGLHNWMESLMTFAETIAPNVAKNFSDTQMDEAIEWASS